MKLIPLTRGLFAMVDDEDYDSLIAHKWNAHLYNRGGYSYAQRGQYLGGGRGNPNRTKTIHMHRVIMNVEDDFLVDHKDGDTLNNQKYNLRICTRRQNNANRKKSRSCTESKYLGVCQRKETGRWRARIRVNKVGINLGHFGTAEDAALAYNEAAVKYHGEFAKLNIITK